MFRSPYFQTLLVLVLAWALNVTKADGQTPAPTQTSRGDVGNDGLYRVVPGDTLYGISSRFGVTVAQLSSLNDLGSSPSLSVGQTLEVPGYAAADPADGTSIVVGRAGSQHYRVQPKDTLSSIARALGVPVAALASANDIRDPDQLSVGQILIVPGGAGSEAVASAASDGETQAEVTHRVAKGETLNAIAGRYRVEVSALMNANSLTNPDQLSIGQQLRIPSAHGAVAGSASGGGASLVALPGAPTGGKSGVFLDPIGPGSHDASSPTPVTPPREVVVSTAPSTPVMLPDPPPLRGTKFQWPARGRVLTRFGRQSNGKTADGIEIKVAAGAPISAAEDGVVAFAGTGVSGRGYLVLLKHADGYYTAYAQNSNVTVARGDLVSRGDVIAHAGNRDTGVNGRLHFEVRFQEDPVNPIIYLES